MNVKKRGRLEEIVDSGWGCLPSRTAQAIKCLSLCLSHLLWCVLHLFILLPTCFISLSIQVLFCLFLSIHAILYFLIPTPSLLAFFSLSLCQPLDLASFLPTSEIVPICLHLHSVSGSPTSSIFYCIPLVSTT